MQQHTAGHNPGLCHSPGGTEAYYLFERKSATQAGTDLQEKEDAVLDSGKAVRCGYCKTVITYQANAERIQAQHTHTFINPGGYEFTIGCYRRAWCKVMGLPMLEWSWFSGYTWQYALCPQCQEHLGWFYHCAADDSSFYGLILDRLIIDASDSGTE